MKGTEREIAENLGTRFRVRACSLTRVISEAVAVAATRQSGFGAVVSHGGAVANAYAYPAETEIAGAVAIRQSPSHGVAYGVTGRMPANKATLSGAARHTLGVIALWDHRYPSGGDAEAKARETLRAECERRGDVRWHRAGTGAVAWRVGCYSAIAIQHPGREGKAAQPVTMAPKRLVRIMRRLARPGWAVVVTPPSHGAAPIPAYREIATGEEYHVGDRESMTPRHFAAQAFAVRARAREDAALAALIDTPEGRSVNVCARDSRAAGNCDAGTRSFAERHALDLRRHYEAGELLAVANGDARSVRAAVLSAIRRERRESAAGECLLAEHAA